MNWHSWQDFFAMGGYALYVWGSLGATGAALLLEIFLLARRRRAILMRHARRAELESMERTPNENQA